MSVGVAVDLHWNSSFVSGRLIRVRPSVFLVCVNDCGNICCKLFYYYVYIALL
jgi:hypothetical protein